MFCVIVHSQGQGPIYSSHRKAECLPVNKPTVRLYLKDAPSKDEIIAVRNALGTTADAMMRKGEKVFKELDLAQADEDALIAAMVDHPILIERPLLIHGSKAVIGRPPETVLGIL